MSGDDVLRALPSDQVLVNMVFDSQADVDNHIANIHAKLATVKMTSQYEKFYLNELHALKASHLRLRAHVGWLWIVCIGDFHAAGVVVHVATIQFG